MAAPDLLAASFCWPDVLLRTLHCTLGASLPRSLLFCSNGTDSDFTGGAGSWEQASAMVEAAAPHVFPHAPSLSLVPRTICETCLANPVAIIFDPHAVKTVGDAHGYEKHFAGH